MRLEGESWSWRFGVPCASGMRWTDSGGRAEAGREEGGLFSASDDCGDEVGVWFCAGRGAGDATVAWRLDVLLVRTRTGVGVDGAGDGSAGPWSGVPWVGA